jgi:hypothetical protein
MVLTRSKNICKVVLPADGVNSLYQGYNNQRLDSVAEKLKFENLQIRQIFKYL